MAVETRNGITSGRDLLAYPHRRLRLKFHGFLFRVLSGDLACLGGLAAGLPVTDPLTHRRTSKIISLSELLLCANSVFSVSRVVGFLFAIVNPETQRTQRLNREE